MQRPRVLATVLGLSLMLGVRQGRAAPPINTTDDYTKACAVAIGVAAIPKFDCYGSANGWTVKEIELRTTDDTTGKSVKVTAPKDNTRAGLENDKNCDTPFLIPLGEDTNCVPYATLGFKEVDSDKGGKAKFVFICRPYFFRKPGAAKKDEPPRVRFDDLGFIAYHPDTGATCFWSVPINKKRGTCKGGVGTCFAPPFGTGCACDTNPQCKSGECRGAGYCVGGAGNCTTKPYGTSCACAVDADCTTATCQHSTLSFAGDAIPVPGSSGTPGTTDVDFWNDGRPANKNFWKTLPVFVKGGQCMECHDSDPFIHTPVIDKVGLVPSLPKFPYWPVAETDLVRIAKAAGDSGDEWHPAKVLKPTAANEKCTGCHRIGSRRTCRRFVDDSSGISKYGITYDKRYMAGGRYAYDRWMKPAFDPEGIKKKFPAPKDWTAAFGKTVTAIKACCKDQSSTSCWRDMPRKLADAQSCCATPTGIDFYDYHYVESAVCQQQPGAFPTDPALCSDAAPETCCRFADDGSLFHDELTTDQCTQIGGDHVDESECVTETAQVCCQSGDASPYFYAFHSTQECRERLNGVAVDPSLCPTSVCCRYSSDAATRYTYASPEECTDELAGTVQGDNSSCDANDADVCCALADGQMSFTKALFCTAPATVVDSAACSCSALGGTLCETGGNGACRGEGPAANDCEHCCGGTATPTCERLGGTTCELAGNGACAGSGPTTYDCDHCCGGLAHSVPCPELGGGGSPFGGDDLGCLPPDQPIRICETFVAKTMRKAAECVLKCHRRRARGVISASGQETCETSCEESYRHAVSKPRLDAICPTCLSAPTRLALFTLADTIVGSLNGSLFCAPGTPFGDDEGFVPSDDAAARCEHEVAKLAGKAMRCITKCHQKRARGLIDAAGEEACESDDGNPNSCRSKYRRRVGGLPHCPDCLTQADRDTIYTAIESTLDFTNAAVYCAP